MKLFFALVLVVLATAANAQTATATVGQAFTYQWPVAGGGYDYITNGTQNSLPPGLAYNPSTGILSGTPSAAGSYSLVLQLSSGSTPLALTVTPSGVTPPPNPPALFCAADPNPSCGVALTWTAPTASTDPVVGYQVFRNSAQLTTAAITGTAYTDKTVAPSTTYTYYVVSIDAAGAQSAPSNTVSIVVPTAVPPPPPPTPAPPTGLTGTIVQ